MYRMAATTIIALAWCFLSVDEHAVASQPSATCTIEFRIADPSAHGGNDLVLLIELRPNETGKFSLQQFGLTTLTQFLHSLRESAIDTLVNQLRMA